MSAAEVLQQAEAGGIHLWVEGDRLRWQGPRGALDDQLRAGIEARRAEVMVLLREPSGPAPGGMDSRGDDPTALDGSPTGPLRLRDRCHDGALGPTMAWLLYSRALDRELWLCRDQKIAWTVWNESRLPTLLLDEWDNLEALSAEDIGVVLNVRATFGQSAAIRAVRRGGAHVHDRRGTAS